MFDEKYPEVDPNKKSAIEVWESRYAGPGYLFGKEPIVSLKSFVQNLKTGKVLDVAMGEGRNAVFLAEKGFQVEGLDCSNKAVQKAKALADEKRVSIDVKSQNLDFFLMPLMKYDSIVMSYFKPLPRFFSEIKRGLVMGGTVLFEGYTTEHLKLQNPPNPLNDFDQCYKPNELLAQLKDFQILYYHEMAEGNSSLVRAIAKKTK
ncbi:MAG: class I SAM-dependent methyltransferase [Deltaproteobacteria bacterium]